jgi:hypothetical protein
MVTMGKKWRFADKDLKNADWCFESPLLPLCPQMHVIPSGSEGSPYSSDTFTLFQLHPFVLIAPVLTSSHLEDFSSGACS